MYVSWKVLVAFLLLKTEAMILFRIESLSDILEKKLIVLVSAKVTTTNTAARAII